MRWITFRFAFFRVVLFSFSDVAVILAKRRVRLIWGAEIAAQQLSGEVMGRILLVGAGVLCMLGFVQATASEVFKWVDKDGTVHYGDRPPDNGPAQQVNTSALPLPLQSRLRSLDPYFVITKFGGNINIGYVCGEFDPDSAGGNSPQFPAQVEATNLGVIRTGTGFDNNPGTRNRFYPARYDYEKCQRPSFRDARKVQRFMYEIRFNADAVRAFQGASASDGR